MQNTVIFFKCLVDSTVTYYYMKLGKAYPDEYRVGVVEKGTLL